MKLTMGGGALVIGLAILCLMPGGATAKGRTFVVGPSTTMEAHVHGSKGFLFSLSTSRHTAFLSARGHHASVHYLAQGYVSAKRIKARFGHLGRVSLRFKASQKKPHLIPKPEDSCKGGGKLVEPGVFVGRIEFEGEQGYTSVHANRARGKITHAKKAICRYEGEGRAQSSLGVTALNARTKNESFAFSAFKIEPKGHPSSDSTSFSASVIETGPHGLSIFRDVEIRGKPEDFDITKAHGKVVSATVEPPAPFTGSATYQRVPASPAESWTGSLAVEFPGLGEVSLTGSDFCAETTVLVSCEEGSPVWVAVNGRRGL